MTSERKDEPAFPINFSKLNLLDGVTCCGISQRMYAALHAPFTYKDFDTPMLSMSGRIENLIHWQIEYADALIKALSESEGV